MIQSELAEVISNKEISDNIYETRFKSPKISSQSKPGQFVNILPEKNWEYVMRRPMSIASQGNGEISIIYKPVGVGTQIMAAWQSRDKVDLIGPLGNYWDEFNMATPILIGGGVGIAPILNFHNLLIAENINHHLIMGARHAGEHFLSHEPEKQVYMSTDDGSLGIAGNVVDALNAIFPNGNLTQNTKIFSCGPPMMMEAVRKYALVNKILCDLALETIMACGFGICQGCTVEKTANGADEHSYRERFALACLDGPIFKAEEIITCL